MKLRSDSSVLGEHTGLWGLGGSFSLNVRKMGDRVVFRCWLSMRGILVSLLQIAFCLFWYPQLDNWEEEEWGDRSLLKITSVTFKPSWSKVVVEIEDFVPHFDFPHSYKHFIENFGHKWMFHVVKCFSCICS